MNGRNEEQARRWFAIMDRDLKAARRLLADGEPLVEEAAYHCQQACEKLIKGCLVKGGHPVPRSHDLIELTELVTSYRVELSELLTALQTITAWCTAYRYPSEEDEVPPSVEEIRGVIVKIEKLRQIVGAA